MHLQPFFSSVKGVKVLVSVLPATDFGENPFGGFAFHIYRAGKFFRVRPQERIGRHLESQL
jgi:hypothetical protein